VEKAFRVLGAFRGRRHSLGLIEVAPLVGDAGQHVGESRFPTFRLISCGGEVVCAFGWAEGRQTVADGMG